MLDSSEQQIVIKQPSATELCVSGQTHKIS